MEQKRTTCKVTYIARQKRLFCKWKNNIKSKCSENDFFFADLREHFLSTFCNLHCLEAKIERSQNCAIAIYFLTQVWWKWKKIVEYFVTISLCRKLLQGSTASYEISSWTKSPSLNEECKTVAVGNNRLSLFDSNNNHAFWTER